MISGVLLFIFRILFRKSKWIFSKGCKFSKPNVSLPYNNIGTIVWPKSFNWQSTGKCKLTIRFLNSCIDFLASAHGYFRCWTNRPFFVKITPRYLNSLIVSISSPAMLNDTGLFLAWSPNIIAFVLSVFIFSFHIEIYTFTQNRRAMLRENLT